MAKSFCVICSVLFFFFFVPANALCTSPLGLELSSADTEWKQMQTQARERQTRAEVFGSQRSLERLP